MIVEGGELINAGPRFPGQHGMRVTSAEKSFVGEPEKFSHAGFRLCAQRDALALSRPARHHHFSRGQIDLWWMAAAREQFVVDRW